MLPLPTRRSRPRRSRLSNQPPRSTRPLAVLAACLVTLATLPAAAQSEALLTALRLHRPDVRRLAAAELATCRKAGCAALPRLSLLVGTLELSEGEAEDAVATLTSAR